MGMSGCLYVNPSFQGDLLTTCKDSEAARCSLNEAEDRRAMRVPCVVPPDPKSLAS